MSPHMLSRLPSSSFKRVLCFPGQGQMYPQTFLSKLQETHHDLTQFKTQLSESIDEQFTDALFQTTQNQSYFQQTSNLQPAIVSSSLLLLDLYNSYIPKSQIQTSFIMGHSLGELTALLANNVWDHKVGAILARKRGEFMESAIDPNKSYGLIALIFSKPEQLDLIQDIIKEFSTVHLANKNSATQVVISGETTDLQKSIDNIKVHLKVKAIELIANVPFHNPILKEASYEFAKYIDSNHPFDRSKELIIPMVSNLNGELVFDQATAVENFINCFHNTVLFHESIQTIFKQDNEIELLSFGPNGKVAEALFKKVERDDKSVNDELAFTSTVIESI